MTSFLWEGEVHMMFFQFFDPLYDHDIVTNWEWSYFNRIIDLLMLYFEIHKNIGYHHTVTTYIFWFFSRWHGLNLYLLYFKSFDYFLMKFSFCRNVNEWVEILNFILFIDFCSTLFYIIFNTDIYIRHFCYQNENYLYISLL